MKGADPNTAAKLCCKITWFVSCCIFVGGIIGYTKKFSGGVMCIVIPIWLSYTAYQSWKMAKINEAGKHPLFLTCGENQQSSS